MKQPKIFLLFVFAMFTSSIYSQSEPYIFKYNTVDYFAPADAHFKSVSKITYNQSEIIIDLNAKTVQITVNYSDGPAESTYTIKKVSDPLYSQSKGEYFIFNCHASNYAEIIIEVSKESKWVSRTVTHNNISHKFYNR